MNLTKKITAVFFIIAVFHTSSFAQYYFYNEKYYDTKALLEVGISAGMMNSFTDVGGGKFYTKNIHFSGGFYAGIVYNDIIGIRLEYTNGNVSAADSLSNKKAVKLRNLSFSSSIDEVSLTGEFYPLMLFHFPSEPPRLSPYILAGIGYFSFNPQTDYEGYTISLQPLHTEGEGFKEYPKVHNYSLSQINFPVGGGIKYELSSTFTIRAEVNYRFLSTDYLDDVSTNYIDPSLFSKYLSPTNAALAQALYNRRDELQPRYVPPVNSPRTSTAHNDAYYTFNLKLGINLNREKR